MGIFDFARAAIANAITRASNAATPITPPRFDGPLDRIPRNRVEVIKMLGNPGVGSPDPAWVKANIITVRDLPGVPPHWHFQCHRKIEPYIREGLRRAKEAAPEYEIERAASFVHRHQRHDTLAKAKAENRPIRPLSYHSWGVAFDVDSPLNYSRTFSPSTNSPIPFGERWSQIWPQGLPESFVEAIESVGFAWGGRWKGFVDPMHFEFVGQSDVQV